MIDKKCLASLKRGVEYWNNWRKKNLHIRVNFQGINLSNKVLIGIDFTGVNLAGAILVKTNFCGANLD